MRKYGEYDNLSEDITKKLDVLMSYIEQSRIRDIAFYYGYPIIELDKTELIMKGCIISLQGIISLYENKHEEIVYSRHLTQLIMNSDSLSELYFSGKKIIYSYCIDDIDLILNVLSGQRILSIDQYRCINGIFQNAFMLNVGDDRTTKSLNSLGATIKLRNNQMNMLDENQFNSIYKRINNHIRIRGLAGSGKTILLVKKMAYIHFKYRELDLAYVFFSISLKQYIEGLFRDFYRDFEKYKAPDMSKIHILHAWGRTDIPGFYSKVCEDNGLAFRNLNEAKQMPGDDKFEAVCREVLLRGNGNFKKTYHHVFIDEAQDFKLPFFKLVLQTIKPTGTVVYAYDELQALNNYKPMPSKREIFGDEECEDVNLSVCYRTPKEILVTAHALGLGIYRKDKEDNVRLVNMMEDYSIWTAVGYRIKEGELGYGKYVVLERSEEIKYKPPKCVEIIQAPTIDNQYEYVCEEIIRLISTQDVLPEDIIIIDLSTVSLKNDFISFRNCFLGRNPFSNVTISLVNNDNPYSFKKTDSITFSTIFRAKGNEANIVFVINAQSMNSMLTYSRNRLFTAMTRAKFKTYVLGEEGKTMKALASEYEAIQENDFTLSFVYPKEEELKQMQSIAKKESEQVDKMQKVIKDTNGDADIIYKALKEQVGASDLEELFSILKKKYENE